MSVVYDGTAACVRIVERFKDEQGDPQAGRCLSLNFVLGFGLTQNARCWWRHLKSPVLQADRHSGGYAGGGYCACFVGHRCAQAIRQAVLIVRRRLGLILLVTTES